MPDHKALPPVEDGPIGYTVGIQNGLVVVQFTRATRWVGLRPSEAIALAALIRVVAQDAAASQIQ